MADENESVKRAREELEKERELTEESRRQYAERMKGRPTPTQQENDLAVLGAHILEHEDDGSGPDPFDWSKARERQLEGARGGGYQTRQLTPQPSRPAGRPVSPTSTHGGGSSSS